MPAPKKPNTAAATEARRRVGYKRINITISEGLLPRLDAAADNRSAFIEAAVREKLEREPQTP